MSAGGCGDNAKSGRVSTNSERLKRVIEETFAESIEPKHTTLTVTELTRQKTILFIAKKWLSDATSPQLLLFGWNGAVGRCVECAAKVRSLTQQKLFLSTRILQDQVGEDLDLPDHVVTVGKRATIIVIFVSKSPPKSTQLPVQSSDWSSAIFRGCMRLNYVKRKSLRNVDHPRKVKRDQPTTSTEVEGIQVEQSVRLSKRQKRQFFKKHKGKS